MHALLDGFGTLVLLTLDRIFVCKVDNAIDVLDTFTAKAIRCTSLVVFRRLFGHGLDSNVFHSHID